MDSEEAWVFEVSEARHAPASWAGTERKDALMPGMVTVAVVAQDPEVQAAPFVRFDPEQSPRSL